MTPVIYFWKRTPFIRLFVPLATGIILQWYLQPAINSWWIILACSFGCGQLFFILSFFHRFRFGWLEGVFINCLFISIGALLAGYNDIRNDKCWYGRIYHEDDFIVATLDEPLTKKEKSFKAVATVDYVINAHRSTRAHGKCIIYFKKDSTLPKMDYGSRIIFKGHFQRIKNTGNPGSLDYERYCLFQGITHQAYLNTEAFKVLDGTRKNWLNSFLYTVRDGVIHIFRKNIKGVKESGLAEALLIGYKDDLDKTLVQSYSNTGVVHIIAISGMHLALIYGLINLLLRPVSRRKKWKWINPIVAMGILWSFSLLTGASSSVVRAAVMFSFILIAESLSKKPNIYNTLAASAFCLLCYDPYWLWDVGFQLSYAAVLSIVIFMKPIYNLAYLKNKLMDHIWQLNSVTLAAQVLTTPLSIFNFHQFPVYFLLTNFVAVPLSSAIVIGEIILCTASVVPLVATITGKILSCLIRLMNGYVERVESLPFSLWQGLEINIVQAILIFIIVTGIAWWLFQKARSGLCVAMMALLAFFAGRSYSFVRAKRQREIVIYNVPQRTAIDFVAGRNYVFTGDPAIMHDTFLQNLYLQPSRIISRASPVASMDGLIIGKRYSLFGSKKILFLDSPVSFLATDKKDMINLVVISKNFKISFTRLTRTFYIGQIIFDGSVPFWKLPPLKKECDSLSIPYYDVSEKGAFVMNLN